MGRHPKPEIPAKILATLVERGPASLSGLHRSISTRFGSAAAGSVQSYYNAVENLENLGYVESRVEEPSHIRGGRSKIVYEVTPNGIDVAPKSIEDAINAKALGWTVQPNKKPASLADVILDATSDWSPTSPPSIRKKKGPKNA